MSKIEIKNLPWSIPVPVKRSTFYPLHSSDERFNIEVDLSKIGAFSNRKKPLSSREIIYSDLQTNADANGVGRLGSGRAGFYLGKYIKGIGRTLLAGNWNNTMDAYHSSGLLFASSAIKEYFISSFLRKKGKDHLINPCTGLLMKRMSKEFRDHPKNVFVHGIKRTFLKTSDLLPVDSSLQGLTIKKDDFCRYSNFLWWLNNFSPYTSNDNEIREFFRTFYAALDSFKSYDVNSNLTAEMIAKKFSQKVKLGISNFIEAWSEGVSWGSLHNNFTMDGRFLDLETATLLPCPVFGISLNGYEKNMYGKPHFFSGHYSKFHGFEVVYYIRQVQLFIDCLNSRLKYLVESTLLDGNDGVFIRQFLEALKTYFDRDHPIRSQGALAEMVVPKMANKLGVSVKEKSSLYRMFKYASVGLNFGKVQQTQRNPFEKIKMYRLQLPPMAGPEPSVDLAVYVPDFFLDLGLEFKEKNILYNFNLIQANSIQQIDPLFEHIHSSVRLM